MRAIHDMCLSHWTCPLAFLNVEDHQELMWEVLLRAQVGRLALETTSMQLSYKGDMVKMDG